MDVLTDLDGAVALDATHGQAAQIAVLQQHHGGGDGVVLKVLVIGPALRDGAEAGQYHAGLYQTGLVVVVELSDDVQELQRLLAVGGAGDGEALGVELRDEHAGLVDVPGLTGRGDIALALGEEEQLVVFGDGVDVGGDGVAGLQGAMGEAGLIKGVLQHGYTGEAVLEIVLDVAVPGYLNERHSRFLLFV